MLTHIRLLQEQSDQVLNCFYLPFCLHVFRSHFFIARLLCSYLGRLQQCLGCQNIYRYLTERLSIPFFPVKQKSFLFQCTPPPHLKHDLNYSHNDELKADLKTNMIPYGDCHCFFSSKIWLVWFSLLVINRLNSVCYILFFGVFLDSKGFNYSDLSDCGIS